MIALRDNKFMDFQQILVELVFYHNSLRLHLNKLVKKGLITKE